MLSLPQRISLGTGVAVSATVAVLVAISGYQSAVRAAYVGAAVSSAVSAALAASKQETSPELAAQSETVRSISSQLGVLVGAHRSATAAIMSGVEDKKPSTFVKRAA
jgi:hypothetical protein